ncbi:MAG: winged helix-turn-helix domain-containing protein [Alphaproteobacteria bacterium]
MTDSPLRTPMPRPDERPVNARPPARPGPQDAHSLAGWRVLEGENRLVKGEREIVLEPKVMDVLLCLLAAGGGTVSRDDLMARVWPDVVVSDDSLHRAISRLRHALARDPALEKAIVTVPRRGYRLAEAAIGAPEGTEAAAGAGAAPAESASGNRNPGHLLPALGVVALLAALAAGVAVYLPGGRGAPALWQTRPFTAYPGKELAASFAPGGTRAVFSWQGESGDNWDLYVKPVEGWTPERLTTDPAADFNPAWSPDGETIAFVRIGTEGCRIMTVPAGGGADRALRPCAADGDVLLSWSPDSRRLYFTDRVGEDGPLAVHALNMEDEGVRQVTFPPTDIWGDHMVAVSPDGRELAVARTRALGVTDVYLARASGGKARRLTKDGLKVHGIAWGAEGKNLYFSSNRGGVFGLWQISRAGGAPLPVTAGDVHADSVAVSRDGRRLLYESVSGSSRLLALPLTGAGEARALSRTSGWDWHPALSPDGTRLAFVSDRSGTPELWVADTDGGNARKLTSFGGPYTNSPAWSPDGKTLLAAVPVNGNFDIYAVDAGSGDVRRLTEHPGADRAPAWSQDGKQVFFGSRRTGRWEIWQLALDSGALRQVTAQGGFRALDAGDRLLFVKRNAPGLFALDMEGGARRESLVTERLLPLDWNNWQVTGDSVVMVVRPQGLKAALARLNLKTGAVDVLRPLPGFPHHSGLAVLPGGTEAVITRPDRVEIDLMLMERQG